MSPRLTTQSSRARGRRSRWSLLLWPAAAVALWLALRRVALADVAAVLGRLGPVQLVLILIVNAGVVVALSLRWWSILRVRGHRTPFLSLTGYRLAAFSVSYFTPGTHFGGEPLQAYLLSQRHGIAASEAAASVALDKAIEVVANSAFLLVGISVMLSSGFVGGAAGPRLVAGSLALAAAPVLYLAVIRRGARPARGAFGWAARRWPNLREVARVAGEAEDAAADFCRRSPIGLGYGLLFSALSWAVLLGEYSLMLRFLGTPLDWTGVVTALTAGRLAMLVPLPGALGVLEASQVLALGALGYRPEQGAGLALLIRARDILFGATGLALGSLLANRGPGEGPVPEEPEI